MRGGIHDLRVDLAGVDAHLVDPVLLDNRDLAEEVVFMNYLKMKGKAKDISVVLKMLSGLYSGLKAMGN